MAKVILMCGKICSGKSTYAADLSKKLNAAVLSVDEVMLSLFGGDVGEMHDTYVERLERYLFTKSAELAENGINVIMDIGLWTKAEREEARRFYADRDIENEVHFIDISDSEHSRRIAERNALVNKGRLTAYLVDDGLKEKTDRIFQMPSENEIDVVIR